MGKIRVGGPVAGCDGGEGPIYFFDDGFFLEDAVGEAEGGRGEVEVAFCRGEETRRVGRPDDLLRFGCGYAGRGRADEFVGRRVGPDVAVVGFRGTAHEARLAAPG